MHLNMNHYTSKVSQQSLVMENYLVYFIFCVLQTLKNKLNFQGCQIVKLPNKNFFNKKELAEKADKV